MASAAAERGAAGMLEWAVESLAGDAEGEGACRAGALHVSAGCEGAGAEAPLSLSAPRMAWRSCAETSS